MMTAAANLSAIVTAPGALPGVGHALKFARDPLEFLAGLPAHGRLVRVLLGRRPLYFACDPESVTQILMEPRIFDKGGIFFDKARPLIGNGLAASQWADHRWQRRVLQPAFHPDRITEYAKVFAQEAHALAASWKPGEVIDLREQMHAAVMRMLGRSLYHLSAEQQAEVVRSLPIAERGDFQRIAMPVDWWFRLPLPSNRRYHEAHRRLRRVSAEVITAHRRADSPDSPVMSMLIRTLDTGTGRPLTDKEIHDQVITFLIGGSDTTAVALSYAFYLLGRHPEVERRVHAEVHAVISAQSRPAPISWDDLPRLDYTRRVLTETLRLYPPAWLLTRVVTANTELAGYRLPPGTELAYSTYMLHRDPVHFPDPERFDPDRWLPGNAQKIPHGAMIPFAAGNRKCIGDTFAMTEAHLSVAAVAARWTLRLAPGFTLRPKPTFTLEPGRLPMICSPR
ncbi:cytochrome P450 [Nonomuraea endophytica]|uniref:cytochrome P450 n=1 Tax=Nonomuraea endophytica TaxID=714136 RepID=UPI0037CA8095